MKEEIETSNKLNLDGDLAELLGLLLSDGGITDKSRIFFNNKSKKLIERFKELSEICFGNVNFDERPSKRAVHIRFSSINISNDLHKLTLSFRTRPCNHHPVCPGIDTNFGICPKGNVNTGFHNVKVPDFIKTSSKEIKIRFLRGLFSGDGSCVFSKNKKGFNRRVTLTCHHPVLLDEIKELIQSLGIICAKERNEILIRRKSEIKKFKELIGFLQGSIVTHGRFVGFEKNDVLNLMV